jgi:hypothetical protein
MLHRKKRCEVQSKLFAEANGSAFIRPLPCGMLGNIRRR